MLSRSRQRYAGVAALGAWLLVGTQGLNAEPQAHAGAHDMQHRHRDPAAYRAALDDPARDAYQKPDEVIRALGIRPGATVADIGAGTGYFALRLARAVGSGGRVYAVDVSQAMTAHLAARVRDEGLGQVTPVLAPPDDPTLPANAVDVIFFCNVWHHVEQQATYLERLRRALAPGGRLVMIDFHKRDLPVGPPTAEKIARDALVAQLTGAGWTLAREHTFLPYQYFLEFTR